MTNALTLLAGVAVHVRLERAWSGESLVAHLALVLLLGAGRNLGAELAHHGLRRRRHLVCHQSVRPRQSAPGQRLDVRACCGVIADGRIDGTAVVTTEARG